ncbi:hypothetical protein [Paenibacillus bovis]|uniref:Lipoprotein n=1 Tax=Paenibacillus bovis TaxID=1616788 RepID=A0A172ZBM6_9BACL|nr:hypothetical protein [Paenibacillus bovis]ANF94929.1 hypothetical protein AR543_02020 [Paenibacillus bovis]
MTNSFKKLGVLLTTAALGFSLVACSSNTSEAGQSTTNATVATTATAATPTRAEILAKPHEVIYETGKVTKENSEELRLASQKEAQKLYGDSKDLSDQIKLTLFDWWGNWKPDYESWLKIADGLYAQNGEITAIGGQTQKYSDYRLAMKTQRDQVDMEMGPIMNITVDGNTATLVYHMYLTPKAAPDKTFDTIVTEYNTFGEVDGKLMVTDLHLYTDGGGMF